MLIDYEPMSRDNCHWVVYDGCNKVRCISRQSAVSYINERRRLTTSNTTRLVALARYYTNKANLILDLAARDANHVDRILLDYLAVKLRPMIVALDNFLTTTQHDQVHDP